VRGPRHDWLGNCPGLNLVDVFCTHRVELLEKELNTPLVGRIDTTREE